MKEYKVGMQAKISFLFVLIIFPIIFVNIFKAALLSGSFNIANKEELMALGISVLLTIFWIYLLTIVFKIFTNKYTSVVVNKDEKGFAFSSKKGYEMVSFDDVEFIHMSKGPLVKGVILGCVNIITKQRNRFSIIISDIDTFYVDLPKDLNMELEQKMFFGIPKL